ncbi:MAG: helix-turn-helix domain-containing protein [Coprococcus sp.]
MMIHAYNESYLSDAKQNLAEFFDYAISTCRFDADLFSKLFVQSGYADKFERGNPAIIAGMSGIELAKKVIIYAYPNWEFPERIFSEDRSNVYWAGWALAEYQWATSKRFKDIFSRITLSEIISMYSVYHEMDIEHFIEDMNRKYDAVEQETRLKTIRENRGISQAELAKLSGVKLRSIQMYEQKVNDIDKAQAGTVYKLSRVLGCTIEDLLENPES